MVNWGEASLFWMLIYKATFLPSTKHHLLGYFFHEMITFRSTANKSPTRILSARCVWESTSSFQKPALILLQVHSKEGSPKNSNPVNTFVRSLIRKLTLKESWPVCAGQMWKVNFTTWTVCTLGQETSLGTMWPESDLVGSWDLGTREYFFKEPPTFPDPPPHPRKLPRMSFMCAPFSEQRAAPRSLSLSARLITPVWDKEGQVQSLRLGGSNQRGRQH